MKSEWTKAVRTVRAMKVNNSAVWHIVRKWYDGAQNYHDIDARLIVRRFFAEMTALAIAKMKVDEDAIDSIRRAIERENTIRQSSGTGD